MQNTAVEQLHRENRRLSAENAQLKHDLRQLEVALRLKHLQQFSSSSESFVASPLFPGSGAPQSTEGEAEETTTQIKGYTRRKKKRPVIPDSLPRETVRHELPEHERICDTHGCALEADGVLKSTQVDYIPAKVKVTDHLATKYHCPVCDRCVKTADLPASPIDGSIATPSLLAHVATSKFADGLPLYRQEGILKRTGLEVSRTTLATWMIKTGELLRPFYNLLGDAVLEGDIIYMDETHLQVLATPDKVATAKSYLWARVGGVTGQEVVHFHFDPSRSSQVPKELLQGYRGYVVTDDYGGYDFLSGIDGVIRAQCWMHARRYFHRAWKALGKAGRGGIADQALTKIRKFYQLERSWADEPPDKRRALREEQLPVFLQDFHQWLQQAQEDVPPKGKTGVAIRHALKIWDGLQVFLQDGRLRPDNSPAENAIRPIAVGRKNFLFCQSVSGADATAILYSLVETAKLHGHNPFAYLSLVIAGVQTAHSLEDLEALLPWHVSFN